MRRKKKTGQKILKRIRKATMKKKQELEKQLKDNEKKEGASKVSSMILR